MCHHRDRRGPKEKAAARMLHDPSSYLHAHWGQVGGRWEKLLLGNRTEPMFGEQRLEKQTFMQKRRPAVGLQGHRFWVACAWLSPANAPVDRRSPDLSTTDQRAGQQP